MAEAEELLSDAARHATIYARKLWLRYRPPASPRPTALLADNAPRLDLLITALCGRSLPIRTAQLPPRPTFLARLFGQQSRPWLQHPLPATDGQQLWLPADTGVTDLHQGAELYRVMALQQAMRAWRGSAAMINPEWSPLQADAYLLLEAWAADQELSEQFPGMTVPLARLRQVALHRRPPLAAFSRARRPLELLLRQLLATPAGHSCAVVPESRSPQHSTELVPQLLSNIGLFSAETGAGKSPLLRDWWTGELRAAAAPTSAVLDNNPPAESGNVPPHSAHLRRRPDVRTATEDEDKNPDPGIFMVQADEPQPHAEDPLGLNRPVDRDKDISADACGDMVADLAQARLVATPAPAKEVLLSDEPPDTNTAMQLKTAICQQQGLYYPEWDYRAQAYRHPGARLHLLPNLPGSQLWVDETLDRHRSLLNQIRRHFEMLRVRPVIRRRQLDGDDIDLQAYLDSYADLRTGGCVAEALYQNRQRAARSLAISLLIDISGSTDSWISARRRIIDVEREALLLVSVALESLGEPWAIQAFSGEGPEAVIVRQLKSFTENFSNDIALRISALEPEHYTRSGAAIRHASRELLQQPAKHRLLLLLSDGKPHDRDVYEGQYGVEDMRQAVTEATLQGISAFCLTVDRQAPAYLPRIVGARHYALLPRPELLAAALLDWMKQLVTH